MFAAKRNMLIFYLDDNDNNKKKKIQCNQQLSVNYTG